MDAFPTGLLLADYPAAIRRHAERLQALVKAAVPDAVERVRPGWRLIGYDLPLGRRTRFFAWVSAERVHVHLGFQYGAWMDDPERLLEGAHLRLRKVRYLTFAPDQRIPRAPILELIREAEFVTRLSAAERASRALDNAWAPAGPPA